MFGFVFFALKSLSGIGETMESRIRVKILLYRTWAIENLWIREKTPAFTQKTVRKDAEAMVKKTQWGWKEDFRRGPCVSFWRKITVSGVTNGVARAKNLD